MGTSEELLARYAAQGDAEAFAVLARTHADMVYATSLRILGHAKDAEDVAQESFLELARKANEISVSVGAWLHGVATRKALHAMRSRQRRMYHETQAQSIRPVNEHSTWQDIAPVIDEAIESLPGELHAPLVLHFLEGKAQTEVAQELGISQPTVSRRLQTGIETIRRRLRKAGFLVTATALLGMLGTQTVHAAPPAVAAALGKLAVSGLGTSAKIGVTTATLVSGGILMKKAITAVVLVLLIGAGIGIHQAVKKPTPVPLPAPTDSPSADQTTNNVSTNTDEASSLQTLDQLLDLWEAGDREKAITAFLNMDWSGPVFAEDSVLMLKEQKLAEIGLKDQEQLAKLAEELMTGLRPLREICREILARAEKAGNEEDAQHYYESVLNCGTAICRNSDIAMITHYVGQALIRGIPNQHVDTHGPVFFRQAMRQWTQGEYDEAIQEFLRIDWQGEPLLHNIDSLIVTEETMDFYRKAPAGMIMVQRIQGDLDAIKALINLVVDDGRTLAEVGDAANAEKHFQSVRSFAEFLRKDPKGWKARREWGNEIAERVEEK